MAKTISYRMSFSFPRYIFAGALFAIAGCSAPTTESGTVPSTSQSASVRSVPTKNSSKSLLYVSDPGTNEVTAFAWPKPTSPTATLTGFSIPQGECSDQSGDIFVANTGASNVIEITGTTKSATLADPNQYPIGCAYDPRNGALAVANQETTRTGPGSISLYRHATGVPENLPVPGAGSVTFDVYDGSGNLYVEGSSSLEKLPAGSKTFKPFCPNLFRSAPSGLLGWDGKYLVAYTNQGFAQIKNCKVVGHVGSVDGGSFAIAGNRIVGSEAIDSVVYIYSYPQGQLLQTLGGFNDPIGVAISENHQ